MKKHELTSVLIQNYAMSDVQPGLQIKVTFDYGIIAYFKPTNLFGNLFIDVHAKLSTCLNDRRHDLIITRPDKNTEAYRLRCSKCKFSLDIKQTYDKLDNPVEHKLDML